MIDTYIGNKRDVELTLEEMLEIAEGKQSSIDTNWYDIKEGLLSVLDAIKRSVV